MLVFRIYLGCTSAMPGGITEKHKGRWLLLQVAPETLLKADVFTVQVRKLTGASRDFLSVQIEVERELIEDLLGQRRIFCVLDEAQVLTNKFADCFRFDTEPATARPILRQIIHEWASRLPDLIVSGTGVSMQEVETVLGSVAGKTAGMKPELVTDVGAFDSTESQEAYLSRYLPPNFLDSLLASRIGYWLCGRHRFTAAYLQYLLKHNFQSPHLTLNDLIFTMTGYRVPGDTFPREDPLHDVAETRSSLYGLDYSSLVTMSEKKPDRLLAVASFVFEYTFTGKIRGLGGPNGDDMVEYGVSRFKRPSEDGSRMAETDEPLAILGLVNFLVKQRLTLERYLMDALNTPNASARGFAFEPFGAYLLARAFSSPRPLSDVFEFVGECKLEDECAELVMLEKSNSTFTYTPLNINSDVRSNHVLGYSPSTTDDTLEWLQNSQGSAFCFPASTVGPDLILVLRLTSDGTVLRVCVQFKHTKGLTSQETAKAIRTTDPFNFLSQFKDNEWTTSDPTMQQNMVKAIQKLGTGTKKAGTCGVLRVVCSHPSSTDVNVLERAVKDGHGHPVATVPIRNLEPKDSDLGQTILSLASRGLENPDRKRKRVEESAGVETRSNGKRKGTRR